MGHGDVLPTHHGYVPLQFEPVLIYLPLGEDEDAFEPILLSGKQLEDNRILAVSSGGQHTALLVKPAPSKEKGTQENTQ